MGLDLVELVISFEEEFEVNISDAVAVTFLTPRDVIDFLILTPEIRNNSITREEIAKKVWLILENEVGIGLSKFNEDSRFIEDMNLN